MRPITAREWRELGIHLVLGAVTAPVILFVVGTLYTVAEIVAGAL